MSSSHSVPSQDTGGNTSFTPSSTNINDISLISIYWSDVLNKPSFCNVSITGSYNDLLNTPSLSNVAFTGDYNSLINKTWINSNTNIYNNNLGNIGIGTTNPTSKLHLIGNFLVEGNIIPSINSNFNLGSENNKWKDIYLSGNSIYLDNLILSKNNSNHFEIKDSNNNFRNISVNSLLLNDTNNNLIIELSNGSLYYTSNNIKYSSISFDNYSQIIYSNVLSNTSNSIINYTNNKVANISINGNAGGSITTDTITMGSINKFITNNTYDNNITFNSNVNVYGNYQLNNCNIPFSLIKYTSVKTLNGTFNYNSSSNDYAYFSFINNGSITFSKSIYCDILVVGAGGNGGIGGLSGGGGAGEIILYPSYLFSNGVYNINIGLSSSNSNLRTTTITSNNNEILLSAQGGGNGASLTSNITYSSSNINISQTITFEYNYTDTSNLSSGSYDVLFNNGSILTNDKSTYNTISTTPVVWFKFDDITNPHFNSGSGNNDWTTTSATINTDIDNFIKGSGSILFNASSRLTSTVGSLYLSYKSFTISYWIKSPLTTNNHIFGRYNGTYFGSSPPYVSQSLLLSTYVGNQFSFAFNYDDLQCLISSAEFDSYKNVWTHLTYTYNLTNRRREIYINGVLRANDISTNGYIANNDGQYIFNFSGNNTNTYIDDFRIYYSCLTQQEVSTIYGSVNRSYPILKDTNYQTINPIAWYKFDGDSSTMLNDSSGNGYNLTNNGTTYDSNNLIRGNGSVSFSNSIATYLSMPTNINFNQINTTTGISICFWGRFTSGATNYERFFDFGCRVTGTNTVLTTIFICRDASRNNISFQIYNKDNIPISYTYTTTGINFFDDNWRHINWTISTNGTWNIYVNNVNIYSGIQKTIFPSSQDLFNFIGKAIHESNRLGGNIDDFRIYDRVLTPAQVQELYNGRVRIYTSANSGGSGGGSFTNANLIGLSGNKWNSNYSYISNGSNGISTQGGNGGSALSNIGLFTDITGNSLIVGEGGTGATSSSIPISKTSYGSGGDGNGGIGTNGLVIVKVPLDTCNAKFDGFIYTSNIFDLNVNTITNMSYASNQLYSTIVNVSNQLVNYDNLINEPWINSGLNIYNFNQGNIGIGKTNPSYKLDINGDINLSGNIRLNTSILPFSVYSNTNITTSNGLFSYIPNNYSSAYYTFLTNGSITFPQTTACDILVVGSGGNGGLGSYTGGGGAGEVIAYPNYSFPLGTYNIQFTSNTVISSNNTNLIIAKAGGNSSSNIIEISPIVSGDYISCNIDSSNTYYMFKSGTSTFTINNEILCDILVVGGGGGGGRWMGGGGGAGGVVYQKNINLNNGIYSIVIGNGGTGSTATTTFTGVVGGDGGDSYIQFNGSDLIFNSITFRGKGGGGGGDYASQDTTGSGGGGRNGGSGGGGNAYAVPQTGGTANQGNTYFNGITNIKGGYNGGTGGSSRSGGGGGAGGNGGGGSADQIMQGGIGIQLNITGSNLWYAGGGGGSKLYAADSLNNGIGGLGGSGIGGDGNASEANVGDYNYIAPRHNGTVNTGSGGGGGAYGQNSALPSTGGGAGGSGVVIIRFNKYHVVSNNLSTIGGSGAGGLSSIYNNSNGNPAGTKWNATYSYVNAGTAGISTKGGDGGSALVSGGYTENITSTNLIVGVGGTGASATSVPQLKTNYGSGGDGNGGLGTTGIVIIKVPLNIQRAKFDGYINYSNIDNRPVLNDLITTTNYLNIGYYNQVNFPLANVAWKNEWFLYVGNSPTNQSNSFIFWHLTSNINSKWWFNGTQTTTNSEISDGRIKKEITDIQNPLDKLMLLKPKEYYLCDEKDYLRKYGIIAQDVNSNQELEHLVYKDEDYIANIFTKAIYIEEPIKLLITNEIISDKIEINDELKLLLDNINIDNKEIIIEETPYHNRYKKRYAKVKSIINDYTIEIYDKIELSEIEKENIFIYGKKVNDFNKLDYSSLYTLNIACSKELYKLIEEQRLKIDELEQRIIELENRTI